MAVTDPIADYLTRIRNAQQAGHRIVEIPASKMKKAITSILYDQGYILKYMFDDEAGKQGLIKIALKYDTNKRPIIRKLGRISKPGLRKYAPSTDLLRARLLIGHHAFGGRWRSDLLRLLISKL